MNKEKYKIELMDVFTYDEIFTRQFVIKDKIVTGIEIEREIERYLCNIEIKLEDEANGFENSLYVYGNYKTAHCRIPLRKFHLFNDYENYLKYIAFDIQNLISKEYFLKKENEE